MIKEDFTELEKKTISNQIKNITFEQVEREMNQLIKIGKNAHMASSRCRIGNNVVDFYTFSQRLNTKGKYNINFYEFIVNLDDFKKKKFIQTMLTYYANVKNKKNTKNEYIVLKEVYNICISAINIIRPLVYMEIYTKYNPKCILDFCAGWGGAAVSAAALNIPYYIGIEINKLIKYLKTKSGCKIDFFFEDALKIDYTQFHYDFVFTSPPYYFIQKYEKNTEYLNKTEMNEQFYKPLFTKVYNALQPGGYFIINVCKEVYENVLIQLFGQANDNYNYKKSQRQNEYNEIVYVWYKN
jgi:hypothetical protein